MIKIDENYWIEREPNNVILKYETPPKEREDGTKYTTEESWFFPNVKTALKKYLNHCTSQVNGVVSDIIEKINEVESKIDKLKLK